MVVLVEHARKLGEWYATIRAASWMSWLKWQILTLICVTLLCIWWQIRPAWQNWQETTLHLGMQEQTLSQFSGKLQQQEGIPTALDDEASTMLVHPSHGLWVTQSDWLEGIALLAEIADVELLRVAFVDGQEDGARRLQLDMQGEYSGIYQALSSLCALSSQALIDVFHIKTTKYFKSSPILNFRAELRLADSAIPNNKNSAVLRDEP